MNEFREMYKRGDILRESGVMEFNQEHQDEYIIYVMKHLQTKDYYGVCIAVDKIATSVKDMIEKEAYEFCVIDADRRHFMNKLRQTIAKFNNERDQRKRILQ